MTQITSNKATERSASWTHTHIYLYNNKVVLKMYKTQSSSNILKKKKPALNACSLDQKTLFCLIAKKRNKSYSIERHGYK